MSILSDTYVAVKYYKYNEYGKQTAAGYSSFTNSETYTGAVAEGSNIFYMNARFYDANNGRFLTQDTYRGNAWEPMSQNLYTYVGNNPINYIDPTGHKPVENGPKFAPAASRPVIYDNGEYIPYMIEEIEEGFSQNEAARRLNQAIAAKFMYPIASEFASNFMREAEDRSYYNNSNVAKAILDTDLFQKNIGNILSDLSIYSIQNFNMNLDFGGEGGSKDLYYAFGRTSFSISGNYNKETGSWLLKATMEDRYDFTEWRTPFKPLASNPGNNMNNAGVAAQYYEIGKPFTVDVEFVFQYGGD